jgi:SulP family sulfate permease
MDPRIEKLADVMVNYSLELKQGDWVRVQGTTSALPFVKAFFKKAILAGANPFYMSVVDDLQEIWLKNATDEQLKFIPETLKYEAEHLDALMAVFGYENTKFLSNTDPKKQALAQIARKPIFDKILERTSKGEMRWCGTGFPILSAAQDAEMSLTEYEDFVYSAGALDLEDPVSHWREVSKKQDEIVEFLETKDKFKIVSKDTELEFDAAGVTVATVAIPQAIAYASIAELPPHTGLYAAAVAAIVGSLWGSSRFLATGPVNALSLLVLPLLLSVAIPGTPQYILAASLIAVIAGLISMGMAFMRLGAIVTLASRSVLLGFVAGAALHIVIGQLRHLLGLDISASPELSETIMSIVRQLPQAHGISAILGGGALLLMIVLRGVSPRIPAGLSAITIAALIVLFLGLEENGIRVIGDIPRSLPPPTWISTGMLPDIHMIRALVIGSAAVAALGLVEAVAASQTLSRRSGDRLNPNQEFFGQGLANVASGLFSGYACSGSFTRSALAHQSGAKSHLTGVFTGLTILLVILLVAPYASMIPRAAIAGVLLAIAWGMVDRAAIMRVVRTSRTETIIMSATFLATLLLPLDFAILSGIVFSLAMFVVFSSLPRVYPVVPDNTYRHLINDSKRSVCPQLGIMNIRGPLFFGAVYHIEEELRLNHKQYPGQRTLVLRMHGVDQCDMSGIEMLESTVQTYRQMGGDVFLVRLRKPVLDVLEQSGFIDKTLGRDHILKQEGAIEYLFEHDIDPHICIYECEHRVFSECQTVTKHVYGDHVPSAPHDARGHHLQVLPDEFHELMADPDAMLLDVREPAEHRLAHIEGAQLMPLRELIKTADKLPQDRLLLISCRSGRRTARALFILEDMGFDRLAGLRGGILAWRAAKLPVVLEENTHNST